MLSFCMCLGPLAAVALQVLSPEPGPILSRRPTRRVGRCQLKRRAIQNVVESMSLSPAPVESTRCPGPLRRDCRRRIRFVRGQWPHRSSALCRVCSHLQDGAGRAPRRAHHSMAMLTVASRSAAAAPLRKQLSLCAETQIAKRCDGVVCDEVRGVEDGCFSASPGPGLFLFLFSADLRAPNLTPAIHQ